MRQYSEHLVLITIDDPIEAYCHADDLCDDVPLQPVQRVAALDDLALVRAGPLVSLPHDSRLEVLDGAADEDLPLGLLLVQVRVEVVPQRHRPPPLHRLPHELLLDVAGGRVAAPAPDAAVRAHVAPGLDDRLGQRLRLAVDPHLLGLKRKAAALHEVEHETDLARLESAFNIKAVDKCLTGQKQL